MFFIQLIYPHLLLTLLALSPIPICLYLTRKRRRRELNQALAIIFLSLIGGLLWRLIPLLLALLGQYLWIY